MCDFPFCISQSLQCVVSVSQCHLPIVMACVLVAPVIPQSLAAKPLPCSWSRSCVSSSDDTSDRSCCSRSIRCSMCGITSPSVGRTMWTRTDQVFCARRGESTIGKLLGGCAAPTVFFPLFPAHVIWIEGQYNGHQLLICSRAVHL